MQPSTIWVKASELLRNGKVLVRIDAIKQARADRAQRGLDIINTGLLDIVETNTDGLYYTNGPFI